MNYLFTAVPAGITAFVATNLDDILILLLFFSQVNALFRRRHIIVGQYLGFGLLVLASLPGFFGGMMFPQEWVGLLGMMPIAIGLSRLFAPETEDSEAPEVSTETALSSLISPQSYSVAAVTFANGGDNVGIYVPLFAHCTWDGLIAILGVFFSLVGVWCYVAYQLTKIPAIAETLSRYGNHLVPFVLIGLGSLILMDSHTLDNPSLAVLTLIMIGLWMLKLLKILPSLPLGLRSVLNAVPQIQKN
ncbi:cadmium resistance transporter [Cyanobacteria bacterium FACHB-63]|nr:cadmium resistance transporter [Cyanobacteria bacterium FACHB-63]